MKFAELTVGKRIVLGPHTVDTEEVLAFARRYDDQWFHTDPARAEQGPWDGLIASGWHTCAMAMALVSKNILPDSGSFASPGMNYIKWPHPVRPHDELTLEVIVLEQRVSTSRPDLGVVRWQWLMRNQNGITVLDLEATSFFTIEG